MMRNPKSSRNSCSRSGVTVSIDSVNAMRCSSMSQSVHSVVTLDMRVHLHAAPQPSGRSAILPGPGDQCRKSSRTSAFQSGGMPLSLRYGNSCRAEYKSNRKTSSTFPRPNRYERLRLARAHCRSNKATSESRPDKRGPGAGPAISAACSAVSALGALSTAARQQPVSQYPLDPAFER